MMLRRDITKVAYRQAYERRGTLIVPIKRIWTLLREFNILFVLSCLDVNPIRGSLSLARSYEVDFDMEDGLGRFTYNFNHFFVS